MVQPTSVARTEQAKQSFVTALAEIDELKQTLRYLEISLTKSKEEKEALAQQVAKEQETNEVSKLEGVCMGCLTLSECRDKLGRWPK